MSYDIRFKIKDTDTTVTFDKPIDIRGGTYQLGGTSEAWLNITYNYSPHFYRVFGEKGIRELYGKNPIEVIEAIWKVFPELKDDIDSDYWKPTEGNAKEALANLAYLALKCPKESVLDGD